MGEAAVVTGVVGVGKGYSARAPRGERVHEIGLGAPAGAGSEGGFVVGRGTHVVRFLGVDAVAGVLVAGDVVVVEGPQKGAHACDGRGHDGVAHLPLRGYDVFKGKGFAAESLVQEVQADACNADDGEAGGEGEDYEEFGFGAHLQTPDELDGDDEDEDFGHDVQGADGLPFGPLRGGELGVGGEYDGEDLPY